MATGMGISYAQLAERLKKDEIRRFYVLWGEETYLIEKAVAAVKRASIVSGCEELDFSEGVWDCSKMTPEMLHEHISTPPFLSRRRVVVLHNSGILNGKIAESELDSFFAVLGKIPDSTCLILLEDKVDKRKKKILDQLGRIGLTVQIDKQKSEDLCKWAGILLKREDIRVSVDGVNSLVDRIEGDMRTLENEIRKLVLYCKYLKISEIRLEEIDLICIPDLRSSIFQMMDAIGARNIEAALSTVERLIAVKEPVTRIRFMLARHLRQLLCARELGNAAALASALNISPYIGQKLVKQARRFQPDELKDLYLLCSQMDFRIKTGQMEERIALDLLLCTADARIHDQPSLSARLTASENIG